MVVNAMNRRLLSGNEAVALAARDAGIALGTGYPGTPSTEILEHFHALGGRAQWAPNEKVAFEVALGVAFGAAAALVTMKHVGVNVAADPLFTAAYSGVDGPLIVVAADDPGMASSQNEQDSRRYAVAAGLPMLEPADSQEAYDFTLAALEASARWHLPVLLRMTTRVCHSKSLVEPHPPGQPFGAAHFERSVHNRVMIPMNARPAHRRLRKKLAEIAVWNETCSLNRLVEGSRSVGIVTSGVTFMHVHEAVPDAAVLKLGFTHPLPIDQIRRFVESVERCLVIEEGDPYLFEQIRAADIAVEQKPEMYRFGELNVARARRISLGDTSPEATLPAGKPPALCAACPHRLTFGTLKKLDCIVAGDIGCYTLGALPPLEAMDSQLCMGASIGMGLGLRHVLPELQARRVVSVIGDSTFVHSGITGLVEMVYNPPSTGHVVLILDNGTTAMTGLQEHPGTGRGLGGAPTGRVIPEDLARALGIGNVVVIDPVVEPERLEHALRDALGGNELTVIVVRRRCLLAAAKESRAKKENKKGQQAVANTERLDVRPCDESDNEAGLPLGVSPSLVTSASVPCNVVIAGLGGQGVLTASDILAEAAVLAGFDVKKADVHGMSQRGGSVASDVRFGATVFSPMVPPGEADFVLVLAEDQIENNRPRLRAGGVMITPDAVGSVPLPDRRSANVALLGVLSRHLEIDPNTWRDAIRRHMKRELHDVNCRAFELGRRCSVP
jgi:indolepyruvate ferredoxin oxidoreductase alpha subunit